METGTVAPGNPGVLLTITDGSAAWVTTRFAANNSAKAVVQALVQICTVVFMV
jgi:hypothetical protein